MNFKLFALVILSVASVALAGPTTSNKIDNTKDYNTQSIMTPAAETLKQWCASSQMSQPELTQSFKKLVAELRQSPSEQLTDAAVINGHLCQAVSSADMNADELVKDVYMDALSACDKRECMKQLVKCIDSGKVDKVRANYYMTRLAVNDNKSALEQKDMIQELSESFVQSEGQQSLVNMAIQRQKMFAVTANLAKQINKEMEHGDSTWEQSSSSSSSSSPSSNLKQTVERVARAINNRFVKPVTQSDVEEYKQKSKTPTHLAEKIAERNAALKALANIPGHALKHIKDVEQTLIQLAQNKQELSTVRQSAIEALEQNDQVEQIMTEIALHQQDEPTEVRVAAYRCLMTTAFAGTKTESSKQQDAHEIVAKVLKYVENQQNQQEDEQFCLYVISHLDNLRTSENPDQAAIKEVIHENKQHHMQISLLNRKFKHQLQKFGKSSRNYQLEQTFDKIESGLIVEGDIIYDDDEQQQQQQQTSFLPKLVRVNVSLPILGQTVNVVEVSIRQDNMEQEFVKALRPLQDAKFSTESIEKVVGEFKQQVSEQQRHQQRKQQSGMHSQLEAAEADISIKVDGCTVVYLCADDLKTQGGSSSSSRQTRSIKSTSALEDILEQLKRNQLSFNRGFHFDVNKRIASVLDVEAHLIGGLLLDSRINAQRGAQDFEIQVQMEPRVSFEALVGPATSSKRLLQRASTKSAIGMRLRYKQNELVDIQIDLPMNEMELFKFETQMVEKKGFQGFQSSHSSQQQQQSFNQYSYLEDSIYGNEDIYTPEENIFSSGFGGQQNDVNSLDSSDYSQNDKDSTFLNKRTSSGMKRWRKMKRSVFESNKKSSSSSSWNTLMSGKQTFYWQTETSEYAARAIGLRSKLQVVASPKDLTFLVSCIVKKYEPSMQGYRVQVQEQQHGAGQGQYIISVSTPGSHIDRNMELRVMKQASSQRTMLKTELSSQLMSGGAQVELIHDGRQYAVKVEAGSSSSRHQSSLRTSYKFEAGVLRSSQPGKIATAYKPYLLVQVPELSRPIQIQGLISYQQAPKAVITYELKTQDSNKFIQGKYILQKRSSSSSSSQNKRSSWNRRSMQSPIERMFQDDVTMTNEIVAQWNDFALKQNVMIESEGNTIGFDIANQYKTKHSHKTEESRLTARVNYDNERRSVHLEHRCSTYPVHNFRFDSQYDAQKKQEIAKFTSKGTTAQLIADWQSKKVECVVERDGRRLFAAQNRFERQGSQYHFDAISQYKNQPLAKISGKVPAMLIEEPSQYIIRDMHRAGHQAAVEFDGVVYQPTKAQVSGKLDLQKKELYAVYKNDAEQEYQEIKARFDENTVTLLAEALLKSSDDDAKAQIKINIPGLIESFTPVRGGSSSWKKSQWGSSSSSLMNKGSIDSSEIAYTSRTTQLKAKLVPRDQLTLVINSPRLQHQSLIELSPSQSTYKFKSSTVLDSRNCDVDVELDTQQKMAVLKAFSKQSACKLVIDWPQKKIDWILDVDGVRVLSHQSSLERTANFYNLNSNVEYYQQRYLTFSGKVPSSYVDEPSSLFNYDRMSRYTGESSEINFGSKATQMKFKVTPGSEIQAFIKTPSQQHRAQLEMQNGLNLNLASSSKDSKTNYNVEVDVSEQEKKTVVKFSTKRTQGQLVADWEQNKIELVADVDGRRVESQSRFQRQGDHYNFEAVAQYKNQPLAKISGKVPAMLVEEPSQFSRNMHRNHKAVIEFDGVVYKPSKAQVSGKVDLQKMEVFAVYENEREQEQKELKARFDENSATILAELQSKSATDGDAKAQAKINMPGLIETFTQSLTGSSSSWNKSQWDIPSWIKKGSVESSEIVYNSRDTQLKAKLIPRNDLTVVIRGQRINHQSRVELSPSKAFKLKSSTVLANGRHCDAEIEVDSQQKMAVVKANYKQTQLQFVCDLPAQKLTLFVDQDGQRVVSHQSRLIKEGKYYTFNSQIEYNQQPYAHIQGKIPAVYVEEPASVWERDNVSEQTEINYESRTTQFKIRYVPGSEFVAIAKTPSIQHQSRISQMTSGVYKLKANQSWDDGRDYEIEAELNKPQQKSIFKALNKPTGQILADWSLSHKQNRAIIV